MFIIIFRKVAQAIRTVQGRKSMDPHLATALTQRNHLLDTLFDSTVVQVKNAEKKSKKGTDESNSDGYSEKVGVFCNDVDKLVSDLIEHRELDPTTCDVHVGIDGGQGSLKVGATVTDRTDTGNSGRTRYSYVRFL